jgi:ribosomal protein S18 acetylase RimI-like enzyme
MITLRPATLETVKPLRLRALREDPDSFGSTLEREQDRPDPDWDFWVKDTLIAFDGDTPVGMANLKLEDDGAQLFGMWVAPEARGKGVGEQLVQALLARAGDRPITLCVAEGAGAARRLYERLGFVPTGTGGTLRPGSEIRTVDLTRRPAPSRPARSR